MRTSADPSLDPADYVFAHAIRVRFSETDAMGIVHHSRYLPYLEEARVAYLRDLERPYSSLRDDGFDLTVLEAFLRYRAPLRFDDVVDVHLRATAGTRTTFQMAYLLSVDGAPRATAVTVHGCVTSEGRPTRLPMWLRELTGDGIVGAAGA